jgi:hypothetical protein
MKIMMFTFMLIRLIALSDETARVLRIFSVFALEHCE